jgi:2-phosphosulfolactate phosphatase
VDAVAQSRWDIRCEWGRRGLVALASQSDVVVIVDILSFSTCVEMAVSRGAVVFPSVWKDARTAAFARGIGAQLAGPRGHTTFSLSPVSFLKPRPTCAWSAISNGATLSFEAGQGLVLAGCLRNAAAVAQAAQEMGKRVLVLPAGEQWPDGSLLPCLEDWLRRWSHLDGLSGMCSPEAEAARAAFRAMRADLPRLLHDCMSGQELSLMGMKKTCTLPCN